MTDPCPLNDIELEMITETDHIKNYCYCSECTCGTHICPKPSAKKYPKSIFTSSYKVGYRRHGFSPRPIFSASPLKKALFRLESETTTSHDYKPIPENYDFSTSPIIQQPESKSLFKMAASSTYKADFADWGPAKSEIIKQSSVPLYQKVKFTAISTYNSSFLVSPLRPVKISKPKANINILCTGAMKVPQSTMRSSFLNVKNLRSEPICRADNGMNFPAIPGQYQTVNSLAFNDTTGTIVRRRCKKVN